MFLSTLYFLNNFLHEEFLFFQVCLFDYFKALKILFNLLYSYNDHFRLIHVK